MNGLSTAPLDPATSFNGMFKDGAALNKQIKLLWIGMGTAEPNPFPGAIGAFRAMLDKVGKSLAYQVSVFSVSVVQKILFLFPRILWLMAQRR
jgi:hypothetical protein